MSGIESLKAAAQSAIDRRRDWLIDIADKILRNPEVGFQEFKTAQLVSDKFSELGIDHTDGVAITGVTGRLRGGNVGPTVAILGELDSLRVSEHRHADPETGAAHACGHNCQISMMIGAAIGLMIPEVQRVLCGDVELMAVPAEEFIDVEYRLGLHREGKIGFLSGKQEFIRLGAFDHVDMAMMVHSSASPEDAKFSLGATSNGHLGKYVRFVGKSAHAGSSPHRGVNALQAAMVALHALNTQRETFQDPDIVRLHGILTHGGVAANATPADVRYEGRVRGRTTEVIADASAKMDRCLKAGALALGAKVEITTIPGYFPLSNDLTFGSIFRDSAERLVGKSSFADHSNGPTRGGSTDMGDLGQIMPVIHPYTGGFSGTGHGEDYQVVDYEQAVIRPAKAMAMAVIDLLANDAAKANEVIKRSPPKMTRQRYVDIQNARMSKESYEGK